MEFDAVVNTPVAGLAIGVEVDLNSRALRRIDFLSGAVRSKNVPEPFAEEVVSQLIGYFKDPYNPLTIPLEVVGTPFQRRVWRAIQGIPVGATVYYGDLARRFNTSPRAVGGACRVNRLPLVIPCHRVVGRSGLGGFAGDVSGKRLALKRWLLEHEHGRC